MSQSRLTSGEANKRETRKRENSPKPPAHRKTDKPNQTKTRPRQQTKPKPRRRGAKKTNQDNGQRGGHTRPTNARARREEDKRRLANKERADAQEGSRGRRENAAQAKVGAYSFSGVLRGFWITRQCRSEGQMNSTHSMVERAKQGRSLCCREAEGRHEPIATTRHAKCGNIQYLWLVSEESF